MPWRSGTQRHAAGAECVVATLLERPVIEMIRTHLGLDPQPPPEGRTREAALE